MTARMISGWRPDDCCDPSHREAWAKDDSGRVWHLHETLPGYGFIARHVPYDGTTVAVGSLEDL